MASKYDPEMRAKAVRLVWEHCEDYPSEWAAITAVSKRLGMNAETLRNWIRQQQVDDGQRDGITGETARGDRGAQVSQRRTRTNRRNPFGGNVFLHTGERPAPPPLTRSVCAFIAENKDRFGVTPICRVLTEHGIQIAPRTFYAWASRAPSKRALWDAAITEMLADLYEPNSDGRRQPESLYGSVKMWSHLQRLSFPVAKSTVERLMAPQRLAGRWAAEVGADHVKLLTGVFVYVAFVIDAYAGAIIGWEAAGVHQTRFVESAIHRP